MPPVHESAPSSQTAELREVVLIRHIGEAERIIVDATHELEELELDRVSAEPITHSLLLPAELGWVTHPFATASVTTTTKAIPGALSKLRNAKRTSCRKLDEAIGTLPR
jgi:hypothetical protein